MRNLAPAALLLVASLLPMGLARGQEARAQTAAVPGILEGAYVYPHGPEHARGVIMAALEPIIASLPYFTQVLVRPRLEERIALPRRITVELSEDRASQVAVTFEGERVVTVASALNATSTVTTAEGHEVPVTQGLRGGWLEQVYIGETGRLTVLLSTERDGRTLHVDATMRGERLTVPVAVRLDYVRTP
jgi:hypothetical protein